MSENTKVIVERSDMVAIADSVRAKAGTTTQMNVGELKTAIDNIETGAKLPTLSNQGIAANLLKGKQLINSSGNIVTGTMANNGAMTKTMDGINTKSVSVPAGYTSGGIISLTDDIDNEVDTQADLIAQISSVLDGKIGGGSGSVETCTVAIIADYTIYSISYMTVNDFGEITYACITPNASSDCTITVLCNSIVDISSACTNLAHMVSNAGGEILYKRPYFVSIGITANSGRYVCIKISDSSGGAND